jgi:hypothetical protein
MSENLVPNGSKLFTSRKIMFRRAGCPFWRLFLELGRPPFKFK